MTKHIKPVSYCSLLIYFTSVSRLSTTLQLSFAGSLSSWEDTRETVDRVCLPLLKEEVLDPHLLL